MRSHQQSSLGRNSPLIIVRARAVCRADLHEPRAAVRHHVELLSAPGHAQITSRIQTVNRLLSGFLVYLDRQLAPDASA
jgi:hypothetical protein